MYCGYIIYEFLYLRTGAINIGHACRITDDDCSIIIKYAAETADDAAGCGNTVVFLFNNNNNNNSIYMYA